jgi:FkbM family methyltransferase
MHTGGALTKLMALVGRKPVTLKDFEELQNSRALLSKYSKIQEIAAEGAPLTLIQFLLERVSTSKAQQLQDLIALYLSDFNSGYFVEFGATDGIDLSNTYVLEKDYFWNGILAEPAKIWHSELHENRHVSITSDCVFSKSGLTIEFLESKSKKLSTLTHFAEDDLHTESRREGLTYNVVTISLNDLLSKFGAPEFIDFLSVDTEGSEFEILNSFDFSKHRFGFISVEHNHTKNNDKLEALLSEKNYHRILKTASDYDGWYLHESVFARFQSNSISQAQQGEKRGAEN